MEFDSGDMDMSSNPELEEDTPVPQSTSNSILKPRRKMDKLSDAERQRRREHMMRLREQQHLKAVERNELKKKIEAEKLEAKIKREELNKKLAEERANVQAKIQDGKKKLAEDKIRKMQTKKASIKGSKDDIDVQSPPVVETPKEKVEKVEKPKKPKKPIKIINKMDSDDDDSDNDDGSHIVIVNKMPKKVVTGPSSSSVPNSKKETICRFV